MNGRQYIRNPAQRRAYRMVRRICLRACGLCVRCGEEAAEKDRVRCRGCLKGKKSSVERFKEKYKVNETTGCWEWQAGKNRKWGYGTFRVKGYRTKKAHRFSHEFFKGPIPAGLTIDHLCRNKGCVNPDHLEAVTNRENSLRSDNIAGRNARKTHCPKGHPYDEKNTFKQFLGGRGCRACNKEYQRLWARYKVGKGMHPNAIANIT